MHRKWFLRVAQIPCAAAIALAAGQLSAQTGTISGRVVAEGSGQTIEGAQVYLVGMTLGTRTSANGRYTIANVPAAQYRLRSQMIGYRPIEQAVTVVSGQTVTVDFTMKQQAISLDALVVTGTAGTARNREVGNSISQIDLTAVQPPANVGALLQGRSAGMTVMPSSAGAGSGSMIRLRGNVSVAMSNQPLVYVDGVRIRSDGYQRNVPPTGSDLRSGNDIASPLNDINPNDIERVEVIKGAAASTLYGTEAAAGVIQIFTKRGMTGAAQWTVDISQGFAQALPFGPDESEAPPSDTIWACAVVTPCSGTMQAYRDSFPDRFDGLPTRGVSRAGGSSKYLFIDPWLRNGYQQRYTVSLGGGGEALKYYVSGTTTDEEGVLPKDKEQKKVVRGNFSFTPISNLLFSWNTSYTKNAIANTAAGNNAHGLTLNAFRRDRNYASNDRPEIVELMLNQELTSDIDHLITGGTANWSPSVNFTNKFTVGFDLAQIENRNLRPFGFILAPTGIISSRRNSYQNLTFDYSGSFVQALRSGLRGTLSWGGQWVTTDNRATSAYGENFPGPGKPIVSSGGTTLGFEERTRVINGGFFGQVLLDVKDRYFLTVGGRVDGNSAFGENFGLQYYPRASFSWVASEESFWPTWSSAMKFRVAYGQSGRAPGAFDAVRTWENATNGWGGQPAFFPRNVGNPDLGPERTTELEIGFDAAFFNDRLSSDVTWYKRDISDALFNVRQIPSFGFLESQLANVGKMKSDGVEATATYTLFERPSYGLSIGGSMHLYSSEVVSLGGAAAFSLGNFGWIMEGQPIPVIRTDFCVTNPEAKGAAPVISSDVEDCTFGPNLPTETYGVHTNLRLPYNISVVARGEYNGGHYISDGAANAATSRSVRWPGCYEFYTLTETSRASEIKAIDTARCVVAGTRADYWIYPADFFKVRELSINVPIPQRLLRGARSGTFTLSGHNIWKWVNDDFKTFDPETGNNGGFDSRVRSILEHVPPPAVYSAVLRLTF